jgi:hypothetical protein
MRANITTKLLSSKAAQAMPACSAGNIDDNGCTHQTNIPFDHIHTFCDSVAGCKQEQGCTVRSDHASDMATRSCLQLWRQRVLSMQQLPLQGISTSSCRIQLPLQGISTSSCHIQLPLQGRCQADHTQLAACVACESPKSWKTS